MRMRSFVTAGTVACALVSCTETTAPSPCTGDIAVTVGGSFSPSFDWTPRCGVSLVMVSTVPPSTTEVGHTVWSFTVPEQAPVGPPITYGHTPAGAIGSSPAESLVPGTQYRVWIIYTVGGDGIAASGEKTFIWYPPD